MKIEITEEEEKEYRESVFYAIVVLEANKNNVTPSVLKQINYALNGLMNLLSKIDGLEGVL